MRLAIDIVLSGFALRTDVQIIHHPNCFQEERGQFMWDWMMQALQKFGKSAGGS
jgi:hypothetical protein